MRSRLLLATISFIAVLMIAVPVSSQNGFYEPIAAEAPMFVEPIVERLPPVEYIAPVELIAPGEMPRIMEPRNYVASTPALNAQSGLPAVLPAVLPAPVPQAVASQLMPLQSVSAQPIPAPQTSTQSVPPLLTEKAFEGIMSPQADMILGPDVIDPVLSEKETCDVKKKKEVKIWSGNIELGISGTEGNSETFNFHIGFSTKRKTKCSIFTADLDYNKKSSDSVNTANRLLSESRLERPHCSTPWTWYVHGLVDYDQFQPWDVQINADTGIGYQIIANDSTDLTGRFGGGCSREVGGLDDEYVPELLFGVEFEHRIADRHKFKVAAEYFPDVTDFAEFRMVDKASWEILLDKVLNLSLSLNVIQTINRPNPGGKQADLDYSAVLLWNF